MGAPHAISPFVRLGYIIMTLHVQRPRGVLVRPYMMTLLAMS